MEKFPYKQITYKHDIYNFIIRVDDYLDEFFDVQLSSFELAIVADFLEKQAKSLRAEIKSRGDFPHLTAS